MLPMMVATCVAVIMATCVGLASTVTRCFRKKHCVSMIRMKSRAPVKLSKGTMFDRSGVRRRGGVKHKFNKPA